MNAAYQQAMSLVTTLSVAELRAFNHELVEQLRHKQRIESRAVAARINVGDTVRFDAKTKGYITARVTGFSRDGSKVKATQIGGFRPGVQWTASASLCTLVPAAIAA